MVMFAGQTTSPQTLVTTTEKAVFTTPLESDGIPGSIQPIRIAGTVNVTPGTGTTSVVIRVRQGNGITGTVVSSVSFTHGGGIVAGTPVELPYSVEDTTSWLTQIGGGQYTVTVQQVAASANGTVNFVETILEQ